MSGKKILLLAILILCLLCAAVMVPVVVMVVVFSGASSAANGCAPGQGLPGNYTGNPIAGLTKAQMSRAAAIIATGRQMSISDRGIVVALATASQESRFRVYANDGQGGDLAADQTGIAASLELPHDAVGTDHGSLGVFQQQWPWWGSMQELMDPATSARKFYEALVKVSGWESLPVTVAAQRVQRSAFPDAYADDEQLARQLLTAIGTGAKSTERDSSSTHEAAEVPDSLPGSTGLPGAPEIKMINDVYVGGFTDCATTTGTTDVGPVTFPLPADSGYVNQNNFGRSGSSWAKGHTGNDYSAACGTPVLAATAGTVEVDPSQSSWAGPYFVRISTGPKKLATWYAHMETRTVSDGQKVTAGQQIGTVGNLGNSHGCHLHFEVHPRGGRIYDDPIDPVAWLAKNLGSGAAGKDTATGAGNKASTPEGASAPAAPAGGSDSLTVLSYNIKHGSIAKRSGAGLAAIAEEITASGASVIAIQEADNIGGGDPAANVAELAQQLRMQFAYTYTGTFKGRRVVDNAILSKYPIVDAEHTKLPGEASIQPRGLLHVTLDLGEEKGLVDVYGTHLHFTGQIRVPQAKTVTQAIGTPSCPTLLLGDMNATPTSPVHAELTRRLRDPFAGGRFGRGLTSPVEKPTARIDYVFADPGSTVTEATVMPAGRSDHRGVRTTITIESKDCS